MTGRRFLFTAASLAILSELVAAQSTGRETNTEQRLSDLLQKTTTAEIFSASRYVPVMRFRGVGSWSSPRNSILIDGAPFDSFPLNLRSPDFVPVDLLSLDSLSIVPRPLMTPTGRMPGGSVDIIRAPLPDSLTIAGRLYAGSETGDPVLQKYTRDNLELFNKNKIGISGAASLADRTSAIAYRITGGFFGYFPTGYVGRDAIIISYIDRRMYSRQNRNYLGTFELEYAGENGQNASIYAGINYFVGWEHMPFLSTYAFFEGHTNTVRVRLSNFLQDLDLFGRRDESLVTMRKQLGTDAGEYSTVNYVLSPVWKKTLFEHMWFTLYGELALRTVAGPRSTGLRQLFTRDLQKTSWALGSAVDYENGAARLSGNLRLDRFSAQMTELSGQVEASFRPDAGLNLTLTAGSLAVEPDALELHGIFATSRFRPALARTDTFRIKGNPLLQPGRVHSIDLTCEYDATPISLSLTAFHQILERPIDRRIESILRTSFPGDIVYSGTYVNAGRRVLSGLESSLSTSLSKELDFQVLYAFTHNNDLRTIPTHRIGARIIASLTTSTSLNLSVHGQTRTVWQEFLVLPTEDDKTGEGLDGVTPEFWSLDISLAQRLGTIWFGHEIKARLELQNLFHRHVQYIPISISYDTAVIGYLSFML